MFELPISPLVGEMSGRTEGGDIERNRPTLPRRLHRAILRLLRPAESAVRRLIIIAARGLVVPPSPIRVRQPKPPSIFVRNRGGTGIILPPGTRLKPPRPAPLSISFPLFDRMKRPFERRRPTQVCVPRISYPGPFATLSPIKIRIPPTPDDRLDATRLALRINALSAALDDLPQQALRLARWRANRVRDRAASNQAPSPGVTTAPARRHRYRCFSPLRPGRPPGMSRRLDDDMRDLLTDLHGLAFDVLEYPDTS